MINYKIIEEGKLQVQKHKSNQDEFRLFVPVDFSESAYLALAYAMRLAARCKASIELFHAIDTSSLSYSENPLTIKQELTSLELKAKNKLKSLIEIISESGVHVTSCFRIGNFETTIQTHLKEFTSGIVVVGKGTMEKLGNVICQSRYPLLIVPPSIKPVLPLKALLIRDTKPLKEDALTPVIKILNGTGTLTVAAPNPGILKKLLFKYLVPIDGMDVELTRIFPEMKSAKGDMETLIAQQQPDLICKISRPITLLERLLQKVLNRRQSEIYDVPTLIIPSD